MTSLERRDLFRYLTADLANEYRAIRDDFAGSADALDDEPAARDGAPPDR